MQKKWWHNAVVYQVYPRSFNDTSGNGIGNIAGITEKLDYLSELGIDILWISPINKSPMDDNGYDISDYYAIAPVFGTLADYENLIHEAARRGIAVMMDIVINHTSDEHPWFIASRSSRDNPKRDWYIWSDPAENGAPPNNWGSFFTRSAWEKDETTGQYYLHIFSRKQPDLNWENGEMKAELFRMMNWWVDKGVRGFRLDAINIISKPRDLPEAGDRHTPRGMEFWMNGDRVNDYFNEMNREVFGRHDIVTVGETSLVTPDMAIAYSAPENRELDMVFQFQHLGLDRDKIDPWAIKSIDLMELKSILADWQTRLIGRGWNSLFWNNHDNPRSISRFGNDSPEYRVLSGKMLAALLHGMQGTPYIYQGEEIGMTNADFQSIDDYNDLETHHRYDVAVNDAGLTEKEALAYIHYFSRDNARTPMQWSDDIHGGFSTGTPWLAVNGNHREINVEAAQKDPDSLFHFYKALIGMRKNPETADLLVYGDFTLLLPDDPSVIAYTRSYGGRELMVIANFTKNTIKPIDCRINPNDGWSRLLGNYPSPMGCSLRPYETGIYFRKK